MAVTTSSLLGSVPPPGPISAAALRRALIAGARRVIADRDQLNRINVFPVPDGDTGNNLACTLQSVLAGALSRRTDDAGELLRRVGEDAIDGARGNSGAILAQFLQGVSEAAGRVRCLDPAVLTQAVRGGAAAARQALSEPREGTILSVIQAFAQGLDPQAGTAGLREWFDSALARTRQALADTPRQLPVLARAGVVDAGAKGFVDLLEGVAEYLAGGRLRNQPEAAGADSGGCAEVHLEAAENEHPEHRWCSECLVLGERLDRLALREAVAALGVSCLVIAGTPCRVRVHAHAADVAALFDVCAGFGRLEGCKADDMQAQQAHVGRGGVAVVVDTSADLPEGLAERLGIALVPLRINVGERDYLDKIALRPGDFYRRLRAGGELPRTSQPPPGDFRRQFEFLLAHHPELVYVGLSRAVSGTLQSGETAAARVGTGRARVFDSRNAAAGQALLAIAAAELAAAGETMETILGELERLRPLTLTWAAARDAGHAARGGRVPRWAASLASALGLTAVAGFAADGRLRVCGALFGRRRASERFARYVLKRLPPGRRWRLIVGHGDCPADGRALLDALRAQLDCSDAWLVETGPAVGAHAGPGTLLVSVQPSS